MGGSGLECLILKSVANIFALLMYETGKDKLLGTLFN